MALTQSDLDKLNAQQKAIQAELFSIVTKTNVTPEQRALDNLRIKYLNKQAADIVAQQKSVAITSENTAFNPVTKKPFASTTAIPQSIPSSQAIPTQEIVTQSTVTPQATSAVKYFESQGWTPAQAAGIVGNLQEESGINLNPASVGDSGSAIGVAQWHSDRQANFEKFAGKPLSQATREEQLAFVNYELTSGSEKEAGDLLKTAKTPAEAAAIVDQYYERSSGEARRNRIAKANALAGLEPSAGNNPANDGSPSEEYYTDPVTGKKVKVTSGSGSRDRDGKVWSTNPDDYKFSQPIENPLNQYPSYAYNLSLHLLSPDEFNRIVAGEDYIPRRVLIASAGRYNAVENNATNSFNRDPNFTNDFYFEDMNLTTVIVATENNRNTNAVRVDFTLIEPYGLTLVDKLMKASRDMMQGKPTNYLDNAYLLQIDFFAMNDAGEIVGNLSGLTKRIPVHLSNMGIQASSKGTEYRIIATSFNHTAFDQSINKTPANFEVVARTVADFFQSDEGASQADTVSEREDAYSAYWRVSNGKKSVITPGGQTIAANEFPTLLASKGISMQGGSKIKASSLGAALKRWNEDLQKAEKVEIADVYRFEFDPAIGTAGITSPNLVGHEHSAMVDLTENSQVSAMAKGNMGGNSLSFDPSKQVFPVDAGTAIDRLIDLVVLNSDYILSQLLVPDNYGNDPVAYEAARKDNTKPLMWFKIVPKIKIIGFDNVRKIYAREITYMVKTYEHKHTPMDVAPQGIEVSPLKEYNYLYTGKNIDIIDFDLKFNLLYFNYLTAYRNNLTKITNIPDKAMEQDPNNPETYKGATILGQEENVVNVDAIAPLVMKPQVTSARARAMSLGGTVSQQVAASDLETYMFNQSDGDMVVVKLKILGDPLFIKQDDVFYSPDFFSNAVATKLSTDPRLTPNGSIKTDDGVIYVNLNFRTPVDVDESMGMMEFAPEKQALSAFSGLYYLVMVKSSFARGQFTQELTLSRAPRQAEKSFNKSKAQSEDRVADKTAENVMANMTNPGSGSGTPTPPSPATAVDDTAAKAGPDVATATEPAINPEQKKLAEVANTAPEQPISNQNEPQAVAPETPKETTATRQLLANQSTAKTTEATYDAAKAKLDALNQQLSTAKDPYAVINDPTYRAEHAAALKAVNEAEAANKKAQSDYQGSIQKLSIIKQGG